MDDAFYNVWYTEYLNATARGDQLEVENQQLRDRIKVLEKILIDHYENHEIPPI